MTRSDSCILAVDAGGTSLKAALIPAGPHTRNAEECAEWVRRSFFSVDVRSDGGRKSSLPTGPWGEKRPTWPPAQASPSSARLSVRQAPLIIWRAAA